MIFSNQREIDFQQVFKECAGTAAQNKSNVLCRLKEAENIFSNVDNR